MGLIAQLALFLIVGVVSGLIALRFKKPLIVGYIFGGALLAVVFSFQGEHSESVQELAEVGVALLLFSIGIEFSLDKLLSVKKYALLGGILQIVLTIFLGLIIFPLFGFDSYESLFLGSVFSLSSTAVVVKILEELGQIETNASRITIGWLIMQDIAVVLLFILLGNFATSAVNPVSIVEALFKSFILIALALVVGRKIIPRILHTIARFNSKEIMVVSAFGFCLLFAFIAEELGVSFTLGAFLAGIMISESFLHHEIFSEIKPLQNIFALFFFIIIGSLFSFSYFFENVLLIAAVLLLTIVLKFIVVLALNLLLKMHIRNAIEVALNLAQVGEFAFLMASIGLTERWISEELSSLIISVTILSLLLAPLLITNVDFFYEHIRELFAKRSPKIHRKLFLAPLPELLDNEKRMQNHIILCGYGRVGKYIALALRRMHFKLVVIDLNTDLIADAESKNIRTIYGDATSEEILLQAGIEHAKAAIIALPRDAEVKSIARKIAALNPDLEIIVRRHYRGLDEDLDANKYSVIEPEFEASVRILEKVMPMLGKRDKTVLKWLRDSKDLLV